MQPLHLLSESSDLGELEGQVFECGPHVAQFLQVLRTGEALVLDLRTSCIRHLSSCLPEDVDRTLSRVPTDSDVDAALRLLNPARGMMGDRREEAAESSLTMMDLELSCLAYGSTDIRCRPPKRTIWSVRLPPPRKERVAFAQRTPEFWTLEEDAWATGTSAAHLLAALDIRWGALRIRKARREMRRRQLDS